MNGRAARRARRAQARSIAGYRRCLGQLARTPAGWAGWLDLAATAAESAADSSLAAGDGAGWMATAGLMRAVAAAERGQVLVQVCHDVVPGGSAWDEEECVEIWARLACAATGEDAAEALDGLHQRLSWSSVPAPLRRAAAVLAELAGARRACGTTARRNVTVLPSGAGEGLDDEVRAEVLAALDAALDADDAAWQRLQERCGGGAS